MVVLHQFKHWSKKAFCHVEVNSSISALKWHSLDIMTALFESSVKPKNSVVVMYVCKWTCIAHVRDTDLSTWSNCEDSRSQIL